MTNHRTGVHDLDALSTPEWCRGSQQLGIDDRLEFAHLPGGGSPGSPGAPSSPGPFAERVAVRDPRHPDGPALLFSRADWEALCGTGSDHVVDLREKAAPPAATTRQAQDLA
jgi:hypothetical protein